MKNINFKEATIVDVRSKLEFMMGKIEGSINIPLDQIPNKLEDFKTMKKPLILCCASGNRSGKATDFLTENGVNEVFNGGGWKDVKSKLEIT